MARGSGRAKVRLLTVIAFIVACVAFTGYLWVEAGGGVPGVAQQQYSVAAEIDDVDNLVPFADVQVAGINVGKVAGLTHAGRTIRVVLDLDSSIAPLHQGGKGRRHDD